MNIQDFQFYRRDVWLDRHDSGKTATVPIQLFLEFIAQKNKWLCTETQIIIPDPIRPRAHIYSPQQLVTKFGSHKMCEMLTAWVNTADIDWKTPVPLTPKSSH